MADSATLDDVASRRNLATVDAIVAAAQRLTDEHGLDGFTMDDLAAAVGVSRRTLFNHVPGKIDAVLGPDLTLDSDALETFRAGGPSGDLLGDIRILCTDLLQLHDPDPAELALIRDRLRAEPRLLDAVESRVKVMIDRFITVTVEREGDGFPRSRAQVLIGVTITLALMAVQEFTEDPTEPISSYFGHLFDTAVDVFH